MKLLIELYKAFSPSFKEDEVASIVMRELDDLSITYKVDKEQQIYRIIKDTPLLCAHMDQVSTKAITKVVINKDKITGDGNLGADDKNGIWIILKLLKKFKDKNLSFIFSTGEESGGNIQDLIPNIDLSTIKYGIVFDRRGSSDIVGSKNYYCKEDLDKDIKELDSTYKSARGILSDCDKLSRHIACVNLSCGYYNPHTVQEYTIISELKNALGLGIKIIKNITKKYDKAERPVYKKPKYSSYNNYNYSDSGIIDNIIEFVDDCNEFFYCDECLHYFPDMLITSSMKKAGNYICPICKNIIRKFTKIKQDNDYFYYCRTCDIVYEKEIGLYLSEYCDMCNNKLTIIKE